MRYVEPKLNLSDIDYNCIHRAAIDQVGRKLRSWMNVKTEICQAELVYKEIMIFDVQFNNKSSATISLDTLTGEYGIVKN